MIKIAAESLRDFLRRIFLAAGCDAQNADIIADGVVEADLHGHCIQGTDHIYSIVADLTAGRLNGCARPKIIRETAATALVDGDGGGGHVGGRFAADTAVEKAKNAGAAIVGLIRAGDIFRLGWYLERIAQTGFVGMVMTNTVPARVHPAGGIDRVLGTNPIGFGIPTRGAPIVVDLATSTSAVGHIRVAGYQHSDIAPGLAIDADGVPTTSAMQALAGALTPLGGHKGFALGLAAALLSGPTVGADIGEELQAQSMAKNAIPNRGHFFLAINPAEFGDMESYYGRLDHYIFQIKQSRKASNVAEILLPGERAHRNNQRTLNGGVELLDSVWQHTLEIAKQFGVEAPEPELDS